MSKKLQRLTGWAEHDRANFEAEDSGCTCFLNPPCAHCVHPGNPLNQEVDECWTDVSPDEDVDDCTLRYI